MEYFQEAISSTDDLLMLLTLKNFIYRQGQIGADIAYYPRFRRQFTFAAVYYYQHTRIEFANRNFTLHGIEGKKS